MVRLICSLLLRGRGGSQALPPPYGLAAHAQDILALADSLHIQQPLIIGHSLGAYIAVDYAARYPDRVSRLVLIDGGIGLPAPVGEETEAFLQRALGPALARLQQTFSSTAAYYQFWREHPALSEDWSDYTARYLDYDLGGDPPNLTPRISRAAVLADGAEPISPAAPYRVTQVKAPTLLITATRGLLNEANPFLPPAVIGQTLKQAPKVRVQSIEDTNHYTVLMGQGVKKLSTLVKAFGLQS